MSEQGKHDAINGALMVGADGEVYFVPDRVLEAFRVPHDEAKPARESLGSEVKRLKEAIGDVPEHVKLVAGVVGPYGNLPQAGPTTIPGFVEFGHEGR